MPCVMAEGHEPGFRRRGTLQETTYNPMSCAGPRLNGARRNAWERGAMQEYYQRRLPRPTQSTMTSSRRRRFRRATLRSARTRLLPEIDAKIIDTVSSVQCVQGTAARARASTQIMAILTPPSITRNTLLALRTRLSVVTSTPGAPSLDSFVDRSSQTEDATCVASAAPGSAQFTTTALFGTRNSDVRMKRYCFRKNATHCDIHEQSTCDDEHFQHSLHCMLNDVLDATGEMRVDALIDIAEGLGYDVVDMYPFFASEKFAANFQIEGTTILRRDSAD